MSSELQWKPLKNKGMAWEAETLAGRVVVCRTREYPPSRTWFGAINGRTVFRFARSPEEAKELAEAEVRKRLAKTDLFA